MLKSSSQIKYVETRPEPLQQEPSFKELVLWGFAALILACITFFALGLEYVYNT